MEFKIIGVVEHQLICSSFEEVVLGYFIVTGQDWLLPPPHSQAGNAIFFYVGHHQIIAEDQLRNPEFVNQFNTWKCAIDFLILQTIIVTLSLRKRLKVRVFSPHLLLHQLSFPIGFCTIIATLSTSS